MVKKIQMENGEMVTNIEDIQREMVNFFEGIYMDIPFVHIDN